MYASEVHVRVVLQGLLGEGGSDVVLKLFDFSTHSYMYFSILS